MQAGIKSICLSTNSKQAEDKYLCAADAAGSFHVWKIMNDQDLVYFTHTHAHNDYILKCALSSNNK